MNQLLIYRDNLERFLQLEKKQAQKSTYFKRIN